MLEDPSSSNVTAKPTGEWIHKVYCYRDGNRKHGLTEVEVHMVGSVPIGKVDVKEDLRGIRIRTPFLDGGFKVRTHPNR